MEKDAFSLLFRQKTRWSASNIVEKYAYSLLFRQKTRWSVLNTMEKDAFSLLFRQKTRWSASKSVGKDAFSLLFRQKKQTERTGIKYYDAYRFKKIGEDIRSNVERIDEWTDKIVIVDSILEIPISFVFAPVIYVYGGDIVGFNFAAKKYIQKKTGVDDNAEYVFETTRQKQATVMKHETPRPS